MIWDDSENSASEETKEEQGEHQETEDEGRQAEAEETAEENTEADKADAGKTGDESSEKDEIPVGGPVKKAKEKPDDKKSDKKKDKNTDKKDAEIAELKDRLMRQMAEFDNYRKRTEKEKAQNYDFGASDFILKLLPVVDNFERGIDAMTEEDKASSFGKGIEMIYKQLTKLLEDEKVTEIDALGKEFDPSFHNAVMQQPSDEYESGTVMQVLQKGYMYKDRVLRHSMVMVAQ